MDSYPKKYKYDGFYINQHGHHFLPAALQHPSHCRYVESDFPCFTVLGLTQTGDKSPYYKQTYLEGRVFFKGSLVRSRAIHCALCKS